MEKPKTDLEVAAGVTATFIGQMMRWWCIGVSFSSGAIFAMRLMDVIK